MSNDQVKTFQDWLRHCLGNEPADEFARLFAPADLGRNWDVTGSDRTAAWRLFTEMRTRVAAQRLPYLKGDEHTALESLHSLFHTCRDMLRDAGPEGRNFGVLADGFLNNALRPFTAEWAGRQARGQFVSGDDQHDFRVALESLRRTTILPFYTLIGNLAGALKPAGDSPDDDSYARRDFPDIEDSRRQDVLREVADPIPFSTIVIQSDPDGEQRHWGRRDALRADPSSLHAAELDEIVRRRALVSDAEQAASAVAAAGTDEAAPVNDLAGLAISGGGIRSATFSLGVLQGLAKAGVLSDFDYLSTVSGGGYTGSFLSSYFSQDSGPAAAVSLDARTGKPPFAKTPDGTESKAIRHIRNHSSYLLAKGIRGRLVMVAVALYGLLTNLLFVGPVLVLLAWLTGFLEMGSTLRGFVINKTSNPPDILQAHWSSPGHATNNAWWFTLGLLSIFVLFLPLIQRRCRGAMKGTWTYRISAFWISASVFAFTLFCLASALLLVPWLSWQLHNRVFDEGRRMWSVPVAAGSLFLAAALTGLFAGIRYVGTLLRIVTTLLGPLFLAFLYFAALDYLVVGREFQDLASEKWLAAQLPWQQLKEHSLVLPAISLLGLLYSVFMVNVNFTSPHQFYRNRLSEAFQFAPVQSNQDPHAPAIEPDMGTLKISELRRHNPAMPFHIINTTVNLPASRNPDLRGRHCDFFAFTPCYSGSPSTGYYLTKEFEELDRHLNLGTAVAVSGAAAAPHMGVGTIRQFQFLMTILNVRLSYWLRNAGYPPLFGARYPRGLFARWGGPGATWIGRELLSSMSERHKYLNISDGGHIENLGIYELLRRRCKFIVCLDGEASRDCVSLIQLIRYARTDFGIAIDIDLSGLEYAENGCTQQHFALGRIHYPATEHADESKTGFLLFVKATVTGNEPDDVLYYQRHHSTFPTESTADQFFNEQQFEAYRRLGEHIAETLIRRGDLQRLTQISNTESEADDKESSLRKLFKELAGNLLEPQASKRVAFRSRESSEVPLGSDK